MLDRYGYEHTFSRRHVERLASTVENERALDHEEDLILSVVSMWLGAATHFHLTELKASAGWFLNEFARYDIPVAARYRSLGGAWTKEPQGSHSHHLPREDYQSADHGPLLEGFEAVV